MSPISPAFLDELRARTVLSGVISPSVKLVRSGREWKACCPFHKEKTPSFTVNDEKGFYHCFGCGAHGDAIRFLTDARGMPFMDAVKELADKADLQLPVATRTKLPDRATVQAQVTKKGGAKLSRSETVTVRLDPKLNYLCELAARAQRRTKSSFIEWAIADSLGSVSLPEVTRPGASFDEPLEVSLKESASELWHVDEPDRLVALAMIAPALLSHEEQLIWRAVRENGYVWKGHYNKQQEWVWTISEVSLIRDRLRDQWDVFKAVALGEMSKDKLPAWKKTRAKPAPAAFDADLDDDVPF